MFRTGRTRRTLQPRAFVCYWDFQGTTVANRTTTLASARKQADRRPMGDVVDTRTHRTVYLSDSARSRLARRLGTGMDSVNALLALA